MLVGENPKDPDFNPYSFTSMKEAIDQYNSDYLLGIASQFCIFMPGDFIPMDSDAEGRVAVGGSVYIGEGGARSEYEIGNGDFVTNQSLESLIDNSGFAHAIIDGNRVDNLIPVSWNNYKLDGAEVKIPKKFWITTGVQPDGLSDNYKQYGPWTDKEYENYFYTDSKVFDVKAQFESVIKDRSLQLGKKKNQFEITSSGDTVTFTYTGPENADTVYLSLDSSNYELFQKAKNVEFKNIPALSEPRKVVDNDGTYKTWNYAYIVTNIDCDSLGSEVYVSNNDKFTSINGTFISKGSQNGEVSVNNNHLGVTSLLYNYYSNSNTDFKLYMGKNFQGTILAPNADTGDMPSGEYGHLSGALIAKSFKGKTEFGYRPFTGPISMLGTKTGSEISFLKVDKDGNPLANAKIDLLEKGPKDADYVSSSNIITKEDGKITFRLGGNEPENPPSSASDTAEVKTLYKVKEAEAPEGYSVSDQEFYFEVTESFVTNGDPYVTTTTDENTGESGSVDLDWVPSQIVVRSYNEGITPDTAKNEDDYQEATVLYQ